MPKQASAGGGGRFLTKDDLLGMAADGVVMLARRIQRGDDFEGDNGKTARIHTDVYVVAPEARRGEFYADQGLIQKAIVSKLIDEPDGMVVAGRLVAIPRSNGAYPALNPTSEPEWKLVVKAYAAEGVDIKDPSADAQLFKILNERHAQAERADVTNGARAANAAADDEPPF